MSEMVIAELGYWYFYIEFISRVNNDHDVNMIKTN